MQKCDSSIEVFFTPVTCSFARIVVAIFALYVA
jgi:hypothetical protein